MKKWIVGICLVLWGMLPVYSQCAAKNEAIMPGELLTYELKFNWKFIWVSAGEAKMELLPVTYQGQSCYQTTLYSISNNINMYTLTFN